jgi:hypothetical protein
VYIEGERINESMGSLVLSFYVSKNGDSSTKEYNYNKYKKRLNDISLYQIEDDKNVCYEHQAI